MANDLVISLFRHGLTLDNERRAYIGWTDAPLSEKGIKLLERKDYSNWDVELLFSSPLQRCTKTAELLFPSSVSIMLPELKEMNFGKWEGKTYEQLQHNRSYRKWLIDIFREPIEAGETYEQFSERIAQGLEKVRRIALQEGKSNLAVVTHGGVIRHILHTIYPREKSFFDWDIPFGSGYTLAWKKEEIEGEEKQCTLLMVEPTMVKQIG